MRVVLVLFLLLTACVPVAGPREDAGADLPTPAAPAALSDAGLPPAEDDLFSALPLTEPAGEPLGRVIVSPGNAGEPGLWLRTSRTARTAQGTVATDAGVSVDVVLIPSDGVSQLSAEGYVALGLAPGSFAEVLIYLR